MRGSPILRRKPNPQCRREWAKGGDAKGDNSMAVGHAAAEFIIERANARRLVHD
jgi:hypothetical protein